MEAIDVFFDKTLLCKGVKFPYVTLDMFRERDTCYITQITLSIISTGSPLHRENREDGKKESMWGENTGNLEMLPKTWIVFFSRIKSLKSAQGKHQM